MEWLILILAFFFIGAIVVNLVIDVAKLACRVLGWIIEPKEWWSGSYIHGSFRPRLRTIVIEVLASIVMCALIFVSFVMSLGTSGFNLFGNLAVFGLFFSSGCDEKAMELPA